MSVEPPDHEHPNDHEHGSEGRGRPPDTSSSSGTWEQHTSRQTDPPRRRADWPLRGMWTAVGLALLTAVVVMALWLSLLLSQPRCVG